MLRIRLFFISIFFVLLFNLDQDVEGAKCKKSFGWHNESQRKGAQSCPRASHMARMDDNYDDLIDPKDVN